MNNKIILKSKNQLWDENNKLEEQINNLKWENKQIKEQYEQLEEKTNYLIYHLNKVFEKLPEFIQKIVSKLFNNKVLSLFSFKHDYDPDIIAERNKKLEKERKQNSYKSYYYKYEEEIDKEHDDGIEL